MHQVPKLTSIRDERKSHFNRKLINVHEKALRNLVKVEMKLYDSTFWWECPNVCRWEPHEESDDLLERNSSVKKNMKNQIKLPKIQVRDFNLTQANLQQKLSTLVRNYLAPMIPAEMPLYHDELEAFENKCKAWKFILHSNSSLQEDDNEDDLMAIENLKQLVGNVGEDVTLSDFIKWFDGRSLGPQYLFPLLISSKIEVIDDPREIVKVQIKREELRKNVKKSESGIDIGQEMPIANEAQLLSELLMKVEKFNESRRIKRTRTSFPGIIISKPNAEKSIRSPADVEPLVSQRTTGNEKILYVQGKFTTNGIHEMSYDAASKSISFYTEQLGTFGIAVRKFKNLPFKFWEILPSTSNGAKFIKFIIETQKAKIEFKITENGYTFEIITPRKGPMQQLINPVKINQLKKVCISYNSLKFN